MTESTIRKAIKDATEAVGGQAELIDAATPGLRFRPTRDGRGIWSLMVRDQAGRNRRFGLGEFPTIGVSQAREQAGLIRHKVRQEGVDPTEERREKRAAAREPDTVPETTLAGLLIKYGEHVGGSRKSWGDAHRRIGSVFGSVLTRDLKTMTRAELQIVADNWPSKSSASAAVRYLRPVIKWGAVRDYAPLELAAIQQTGPAGRRSRFLSPDELGKLLKVLKSPIARPGSRGGAVRPHVVVMRFLLLTAARLDQAALARWNEFTVDQDGRTIWTIPPSRVKRTRLSQTPKPHIVPLSRQAAALIESRRTDDVKPDGLVFPSSSGRPLGNWDKETKIIQKATGVDGWQRHDLRRTAATSMGVLGIAPHVIEAVLGHTDIHSSLAGIYNQSRYEKEVGEALQMLADWMESVVSNR
ncbi:MAG: site-specific integrase [Acidiphilium sp.]|nr:site-specific integrase [Acidiphilium sp.]